MMYHLPENIRASMPEASSDDLIKTFSDQLSFNDSQLSELEKVSRNQSDSKSRWEQRKGRISASKFHEVFSKVQVLFRNRGKPLKCKVSPLILSLVDPQKLKNIPSLEWGKSHETSAAEAFMKYEGEKRGHNIPKLLTSGLYVSKPHPYLGATPSIKYYSIEEALGKMTFLELLENNTQLKRNHQYYTQIIGQMALTGYSQTYFVV